MENNYVSDAGWRNMQFVGKLCQKGPKDGVKIKVYMPSGLCKKTFHRGGSYQVHDNLASKYSFKIMYIMIQMFCYFRKLWKL